MNVDGPWACCRISHCPSASARRPLVYRNATSAQRASRNSASLRCSKFVTQLGRAEHILMGVVRMSKSTNVLMTQSTAGLQCACLCASVTWQGKLS